MLKNSCSAPKLKKKKKEALSTGKQTHVFDIDSSICPALIYARLHTQKIYSRLENPLS